MLDIARPSVLNVGPSVIAKLPLERIEPPIVKAVFVNVLEPTLISLVFTEDVPTVKAELVSVLDPTLTSSVFTEEVPIVRASLSKTAVDVPVPNLIEPPAVKSKALFSATVYLAAPDVAVPDVTVTFEPLTISVFALLTWPTVAASVTAAPSAKPVIFLLDIARPPVLNVGPSVIAKLPLERIESPIVKAVFVNVLEPTLTSFSLTVELPTETTPFSTLAVPTVKPLAPSAAAGASAVPPNLSVSAKATVYVSGFVPVPAVLETVRLPLATSVNFVLAFCT